MSLNRERNDEKETEFVNRELFAANRHSLSQEEVFMERESGFYYLPVELVIHIWKFLDAHIIDTILTRTCRLWNQIVAKNGSRLPAHQLEDVKIENRPGTGETIELLSRKTCWDACTISSFCTISYGIYIDFLSLHQRLNRISPVDDLELQFHGQNARDVLRAVSKVARNHWKPRRLFVYGKLHTGDGGILKAAMSNLNAIENLKWLVMRVRMDFGGFDVTPFLTKQLEHIDIGGGFPYSASNLITDDVFVSMLHEKTREIRIDGASITVAGVKRFIEKWKTIIFERCDNEIKPRLNVTHVNQWPAVIGDSAVLQSVHFVDCGYRGRFYDLRLMLAKDPNRPSSFGRPEPTLFVGGDLPTLIARKLLNKYTYHVVGET